MKDEHESKHGKKPELFIDNTPYQWEKETITGAEVRRLARLPENVQIFLEQPGSPDKPIGDTTVVHLEEHGGPKRFSSQAVGSQAGEQ